MENFDLIREWAKNKGIYESGDPKTQYLKLQEEAGELARAILKKDEKEIIDALGDCVVVLVNLSELCGYKLEDCIESAYDVIKNRVGKMENGTFVKQDKKTHVLNLHKNGYYNLPCIFKDINLFLEKNNISINGKIYGNADDIHLKAKPSRNGGVAYIYKKDL